MQLTQTIAVPEWKRSAYAFDFKGKQIPKLGIKTEILAAIAWYKQLYRRVKQLGKTLIIQVDGEHRSWKSIKTCEMGVILDPSFEKYHRNSNPENLNPRIVHSKRELMDMIEDIVKNNHYGAFIMVDEAGATVNKREYYDDIAQAINQSIQVLGKWHIIIAFVAPIKGEVLSSLQRMTNLYIHVERNSNEYTSFNVYNMKYNSIKKQDYPKKPIVRLFGSRFKLKKLKLCSAPDWIVQKYQEIEDTKKPIMLKKMREKSLESEIKEIKKDPYELIEKVVKNWEEYKAPSSTHEKIILDRFRLKGKLEISQGDAAFIKAEAEERLEPLMKANREKAEAEREQKRKEKESAKEAKT